VTHYYVARRAHGQSITSFEEQLSITEYCSNGKHTVRCSDNSLVSVLPAEWWNTYHFEMEISAVDLKFFVRNGCRLSDELCLVIPVYKSMRLDGTFTRS
jgi:hypothetical protein